MRTCKQCNKPVHQTSATWIGDIVKRYYICDKCNVLFVEFVYSPVHEAKSNLVPHEVFKVKSYNLIKKTIQSTLV